MADTRKLVQVSTVVNAVSNPSGEIDATGWSAGSGAGSMSAPASVSGARTGGLGTKHVESTGTSVTAAAGCWLQTDSAHVVPCAPSQRVYVYAWLKAATSATALELRIQWLDSGKAVLSTSSVQTQSSPVTGTWYELQGAASAPASTAYVRVLAYMNNGTNAPQLFVDDVAMVLDATYAAGYFEVVSQQTATVKDLEVSGTYNAIRGSFSVQAPERQTSFAGASRRYYGQVAVGETHGNGAVSWDAWVQGASYDQVLQNVESMLSAVEPLTYPGLHLEWRPSGATYSTFFEVRGPARWEPTYKYEVFAGGKAMQVRVQIPVAPLGKQLPPVSQPVPAFTSPAVVQLPAAVGGSAPAACEFTFVKPSTAGPAFGLVAWWRRLATPPSGYNKIFGLIEAESAYSLTTFTSGADAGASGGNRVAATASGAGSGTGLWRVFASGQELNAETVDVEVWAGVYLPTTVVSPRIVAYTMTEVGIQSQILYTREWGSAGKPLSVPTAAGYRLSRVGSFTVPVGAGNDARRVLGVQLSWAAGSTGTVGLDWLMLVPAGQRACSPTDEANDSSYPQLMPNGTSYVRKHVSSDLAGLLMMHSSSPPSFATDSGLGGAAIEVPPGNVDLGIIMHRAVADEPASANVQGTPIAGGGHLTVTPRFYLVRGA